jgi:hypothetical protein
MLFARWFYSLRKFTTVVLFKRKKKYFITLLLGVFVTYAFLIFIR